MTSNEDLPYINLDLAGREFTATPLNAHFFSFAGHTLLENGDVIDNASRNHVFLETGDTEDDTLKGTYIFEPNVVAQMGAMMIANGFHCDINRRGIPVGDEQAYQTYINQQAEYDEAPDFIPDDWQ